MRESAEAGGHRQRLREKYFRLGLDALTDEEVVELLLTLATPRQDCKPLARAAVSRFGSLRGVLEAAPPDWSALPGLGPRNVLGLRLVHEVARRFLRDRLLGREVLGSAKEVFDFLYHSFRDRPVEVTAVLFLDARNAVLAVEENPAGAAAGGQVQPEAIMRRALAINAVGLILVHNHPSGRVEPSPADGRVTRDLALAARAVGLRLVDHLIVGENRYFSFSETGQIRRFEDEFEGFKRLTP